MTNTTKEMKATRNITVDQMATARKRLEEAIFGEVKNEKESKGNSTMEKKVKENTVKENTATENTVKENNTMNNTMTDAGHYLNMATENVFNEVTKTLAYKMPGAEYQAILDNKARFNEFFGKVAKATETIVEKYYLQYSATSARHFCAMAEYMRNQFLTREDAIEMNQNLDKLYEFFGKVAAALILKVA